MATKRSNQFNTICLTVSVTGVARCKFAKDKEKCNDCSYKVRGILVVAVGKTKKNKVMIS